MRVAALYDIHGNLPALDAVLTDPRLHTADVVVDAGSVGHPNDRPIGAYWALVGGNRAVECMRAEYDVEQTMIATGVARHPSADLAAALREPPTAEEPIAFSDSRRGA